MNEHLVCCGLMYSLFCEEGDPGKAEVVGVNEDILYKHVWSTAVLQEERREGMIHIGCPT